MILVVLVPKSGLNRPLSIHFLHCIGLDFIKKRISKFVLGSFIINITRWVKEEISELRCVFNAKLALENTPLTVQVGPLSAFGRIDR